MALGDRRRIMGGEKKPAAAAPKAAAKPPMAETLATKPAEKPAEKASSPPSRSVPKAETPKVIVESAPESGSGEVTVQREAPAKEQVTVHARPAPKAEAAPDPTQQLSVSEMEIVPETQPSTAPATNRPVEPTAAREAPTVAESPAPLHAEKKTAARFDAVGDSVSVGAGIHLKLHELLSSESIKVAVSGGNAESAVLLSKDIQSSLPYMLADGSVVNLVMTYTGRGVNGSLEVSCVVEGAATALQGTMSRAADATKSAMLSATSKARFVPSVIALGAGAATMIASFTMQSVTSLAGWQQYGIAALGLTAVVAGVASIMARIDYNAKQ